MPDTEKQFEQDIVAFLTSPAGGWSASTDAGYRASVSSGMALDIETLTGFVKTTQPIPWQRFEKQCNSDPIRKFYKVFENAVENDGLLSVLRHGFKHRGIPFQVCYFRPESTLNDLAVRRYGQNICQCIRQWHYSEQNRNSVDMALFVNGIPVVALELKNQLKGQTCQDAIKQYKEERSSKEFCFRLDHRFLVYFAVDLFEVWMTTQLRDDETRFVPFNQGTNGPGVSGGAGNPKDTSGYVTGYETSYLWERVLRRDSLLDLLHRFIVHVRDTEEVTKNGVTKLVKVDKIYFPRYHQYDVVHRVLDDVRE